MGIIRTFPELLDFDFQNVKIECVIIYIYI